MSDLKPNTTTPIGGWIKAVFMQEGNLPTVADCCRLAALVEHGVVGKHDHDTLRAAVRKVCEEMKRYEERYGVTMIAHWATALERAMEGP